MTPYASPFPDQASANWQLLAEFLDDGMAGSGEQLLQQMDDTLTGLSLQPQQLERIRKLFSRAVAKGTYKEEPAPPSPMYVRIWLLRAWSGDCGWGFFVVETKGSGPTSYAAAETGRAIQLFLYQEQDA